MTNREKIIDLLQRHPGLDDDELAKKLSIVRQTVNQECRLLESRGILQRDPNGPKGKIVNYLLDGPKDSVTETVVVSPRSSSKSPASVDISKAKGSLSLGGRRFRHVCKIEPDRDSDGKVCACYPQPRYDNRDGLELHCYGSRSFCKFKIPTHILKSGVYVITLDGQEKYIGECEKLSERFNAGYGNISPRNCYKGGQQSNCRINNLIYEEVVLGHVIDLWFRQTANYKSEEQKLRDLIKPEWNLE